MTDLKITVSKCLDGDDFNLLCQTSAALPFFRNKMHVSYTPGINFADGSISGWPFRMSEIIPEIEKQCKDIWYYKQMRNCMDLYFYDTDDLVRAKLILQPLLESSRIPG